MFTFHTRERNAPNTGEKKMTAKTTGTNEDQRARAAMKKIAEIAAEELEIFTLESRGSDRLDFYDLSVITIKRALIAAYNAGRASK